MKKRYVTYMGLGIIFGIILGLTLGVVVSANEITYYYDGYDGGTAWETNPSYMTDGFISNYASTTSMGDSELCISNTCTGADIGTITKVEVRVYGYTVGGIGEFVDLSTHIQNVGDCGLTTSPSWSSWFDITNHDVSWSWTDVNNLGIILDGYPMGQVVYVSKIELKITYTPSNTAPVNSNPFPANNQVDVPFFIHFNITVNDADGDNMNITWYTNKSGTWEIMGINTSVGNGTYYCYNTSWIGLNKEYWWNISTNDGNGNWDNDSYYFDTFDLVESSGEQGWRLVSIGANANYSKYNIRLTNGIYNYTWNESIANNIIVTFVYGWHDVFPGNYYETNYINGSRGYWLWFYELDYELWVNGTGSGGTPSEEEWLHISGLNIEPELLFLMMWFFIFFVWWKSESEDMTDYMSILFLPYTIFLCAVILPTYIAEIESDWRWLTHFIFIAIAMIVTVYSYDVWRKRKK